MTTQQATIDSNPASAAPGDWYVMVHPDPRLIELMLIRESRGDFSRDGDAAPQPFRFFVPFQFMRSPLSATGGTADGTRPRDDLRDDFRRFVFIAASEQRLRQILNADWNRNGRLHLYHYRDTRRVAVRISDSELQSLRLTFQHHQLHCFFGQPLGEMAVGDEVTLRFQPWAGAKGRVERISYRHGRFSMTVAVNILCRTKSIRFDDLHEGDVAFDDADKDRLLSGNLLANFEDELLDVLRHVFNSRRGDATQHYHWQTVPADRETARTDRRDLARLNRLLGFQNVSIDDAYDALRLRAVMLICASLLGDGQLTARLTAELAATLSDPAEARTAAEAYAMVALFVSTHNPVYRDAVKAYRSTHADSPDILRRYLRRVRHIKCEKPV